MSTIHTVCPHCTSPVDLEPAEVLVLPGEKASCGGTYLFLCASCEQVAAKAAGHANLALLAAAGAGTDRQELRSRRRAPGRSPWTTCWTSIYCWRPMTGWSRCSQTSDRAPRSNFRSDASLPPAGKVGPSASSGCRWPLPGPGSGEQP